MAPIDFVDSKDIRKYLRDMGYAAAPIEAAFLIWQSELKTVEEKHAAWSELINDTTDVPIPARNGWNDGWESLHGMLREYMSIEDELIKRLKEPSAECVYHARSSSFFGAAGLANNFEACLELALERQGYPAPMIQWLMPRWAIFISRSCL